MTPHSLRARQLAHVCVKGAYEDLLREEQFAAVHVWNTLVEIAAAQPEPGVVGADAIWVRKRGIVGVIARAGLVSEAKVESALDLLAEYGLLEPSEGGVALAIVPRAPRGGGLRDPGGRPRGNETKEQARERRLAEQAQKAAAKRAQGHFPLPIAGGNAAAAGNLPPKTSNSEVRFPGGVSGEVSEVVSGLKPPVSGSGVSSRAVVGVVVVEDEENQPLKNNNNNNNNSESPTRARARETGNLHAEVFAAQTSNPEVRFSGEVSAEAAAIAADAVRGLRLAGGHADQASAIVQAWLDLGAPAAGVAALIREKVRKPPRGNPIQSLGYFDEPVLKLIREAEIKETPTESTETRPEILAVPPWCKLPLTTRNEIADILEVMKLPEGPERDRRLLRHCIPYPSDACNFVAARDSALWPMIDEAQAGLVPSEPNAATG